MKRYSMCIMIVLLVYAVSGGMCYAFEGIENDDYPEYDIHETYDNADMLYQSYMIEFYDWMNHIEKDFIFNDRVFKGRVYSDRVNELIMRSEEQYPTGLFMNKGINIDICVNEILVDAFGGYIVFTLKNDIYQLKPMDCLYVYSPYYAPAEYYKLPTVFLNCQHIVFTDSEGGQHRFSISGQYQMVRDEGKSITYVVEVSPKHDVYYAENADQLNYRAENILFEMEAALVNETDMDQDMITVEIPKMLNIETVSLFAEEDYIFEEYNI